ncbi:MAG: hypothetical protein NWR72_05015 [Bacteroidia bacterium]|nr:hypothetical protein [Bacteroidia bacterium]
MENQLLSPSDHYFETHMEFAAIKGLVVDYTRAATPDRWEKLFIHKAFYRNNEFIIQSKSGLTLTKTDIGFVSIPIDEQDIGAISCACK